MWPRLRLQHLDWPKFPAHGVHFAQESFGRFHYFSLTPVSFLQMSLYYDAATILTTSAHDGSLKSRIYGNKLGLKSKPAHIYALISETAKYDLLLKEVIDNTGLLADEAKVRYDRLYHVCLC